MRLEKFLAKLGWLAMNWDTKNHFYKQDQKAVASVQTRATRCCFFAPEHIEMLTGSPNKRRSYFDKLISQFDYQYKKI